MLKHIAKKSFLSSLVFSYALSFSSLSYADDTEIFFNVPTTPAQGKANILFLLDLSRSMDAGEVGNSAYDGGNKDRLERMQGALLQILGDSAFNVKAGLGGFTIDGGSILYPVKDLNDSAEVGSATGFIKNPNDDGQVILSNTSGVPPVGKVYLNGDSLNLTDAISESGGGMNCSGGLTTTTFGLSRLDDVEDIDTYYGNYSYAHHNKGSLTFGYNNEWGDNGYSTVGMRFSNLSLPVDWSCVDSAKIKVKTTGHSSYTRNARLRIRIEDTLNSASFNKEELFDWYGTQYSSETDYLRDRDYKSDYVDWTIENSIGTNALIESPNLKSIMEGAVAQPGWSNGNAILFKFDLRSKSTNRTRKVYDSTTADSPKLEVVHHQNQTVTPPNVAVAKYGVALRFSGMNIPQGANITSARLVVKSSKADSSPVTIKVAAEDVGSSNQFTETGVNNLHGRFSNTTSSFLNWSDTGDWPYGETKVISGLENVIQEVTNRGDWCGGNPLTLLLSGSGIKEILARDSGENNSAKLEVEFDSNSLSSGQGCMVRKYVTQINSGNGDARETQSTGAYRSNTGQLRFGRDQLGFRFTGTEIPKNAVIQDAYINVTASQNYTASSTINIKVEDSINPSPYSGGQPRYHLSNRTYIGSVPWSVPGFAKNSEYSTPSIKSLVQTMVNRSDWDPETSSLALSFIGQSGSRQIYAHNSSPTRSARLVVTARVYAGDDGTPALTVRDKLTEIVNGLDSIAGTPIRGMMLEAANYMLGKNVDLGRKRYIDYRFRTSGNEENARISHKQSYTGGLINDADTGCSEDNLTSVACRDRAITGDAKYISPIPAPSGNSQCERTDAIVLLTDGEATVGSFDNNSKFTSLTGKSCANRSNGNEECAVEIAEYLNDEHNIKTYTIAYGNDVVDADGNCSGFLQEVGNAGTDDDEVGCRAAISQQDLVSAFSSLIDEVVQETSSFTAPALAVNTFNRLFHRDQVYLSMFEPGLGASWSGNVKRYGLCETKTSADCKLGQIIDQSGKTIAGADGLILDTANSFWNPNIDGRQVEKGGTGSKQLAQSDAGSRNVYTYPTPNAPSGTVDLSASAYRVSLSNSNISKADLGDSSMSDDDKDNLIKWMLGQDVYDENGNDNKDERRWIQGDPLHSPPVVVTYGGTEASPVSKLVYGGNDGAIRMVNAETGLEEWAFYPYETLVKQARYRPGNSDKVYGVDGEFSVWVNDKASGGRINGDGIIKPAEGEFVYIYTGMRRGGSSIYALDITPSNQLNASNKDDIDKVPPKYMWRIKAGDTGFANLGQTWSKPKVARIKMIVGGAETSKEVLIFGGGYDTALDSSITSTANMVGNSIYIVDAYTGQKYYEVSGKAGANLVHAEMKYPIPTDITIMDSDKDGFADRLYFYDVRAQLWRVDLGPDFARNTAADSPIVEKLAVISDLSASPTRADQRSLFYEADAVVVQDTKYSNIKDYTMVVNQTGYRPSPLSSGVQDRVYVIRDYVTNRLTDGNDDGLADTQRGITDTDLINMTNLNSTTVSEPLFKASKGYFIDLPSNNKGISKGLTFFGRYLFNVYEPASAAAPDPNSCESQAAVGSSKLYAIDLLTGDGVLKFNPDTGSNSPGGSGGSFDNTDNKTVRDTGLDQVGMIGSPRGLFLKGGVAVLDGTKGAEDKVSDRAFKTFWAEQGAQ